MATFGVRRWLLAENGAESPFRRKRQILGCPFRDTPAATVNLFRDAAAAIQRLEIEWPLLAPRERALRLAILTGALIGTFIRIHPFINGNGRTSRLWWRWMLFRFAVPEQVIVSPRPAPPYDELMASAMRGDDVPLQHFVLKHLNSHAPRQA